jgi:hypothetical protein
MAITQLITAAQPALGPLMMIALFVLALRLILRLK